jgi:putative membrane protein
MRAKTIIILILIVLLAIILIQNTQVVIVQLFFWKLSMSRIILISLSMIVGLLIGFLIGKKGKKY